MDIQKNSKEIIRVEATEYKGHSLVSMRIFAKTYDDRGFVPTKKGLTVSPAVAIEICRAIQEVGFQGDK